MAFVPRNAEQIVGKQSDTWEADLADLARLSVSGSPQDLRLFLARLVRRYKVRSPELAEQLEVAHAALRRKHGSGILRSKS